MSKPSSKTRRTLALLEALAPTPPQLETLEGRARQNSTERLRLQWEIRGDPDAIAKDVVGDG